MPDMTDQQKIYLNLRNIFNKRGNPEHRSQWIDQTIELLSDEQQRIFEDEIVAVRVLDIVPVYNETTGRMMVRIDYTDGSNEYPIFHEGYVEYYHQRYKLEKHKKRIWFICWISWFPDADDVVMRLYLSLHGKPAANPGLAWKFVAHMPERYWDDAQLHLMDEEYNDAVEN